MEKVKRSDMGEKKRMEKKEKEKNIQREERNRYVKDDDEMKN